MSPRAAAILDPDLVELHAARCRFCRVGLPVPPGMRPRRRAATPHERAAGHMARQTHPFDPRAVVHD